MSDDDDLLLEVGEPEPEVVQPGLVRPRPAQRPWMLDDLMHQLIEFPGVVIRMPAGGLDECLMRVQGKLPDRDRQHGRIGGRDFPLAPAGSLLDITSLRSNPIE